MMPQYLRIQCPQCRAKLQVTAPEPGATMQVECPRCSSIFATPTTTVPQEPELGFADDFESSRGSQTDSNLPIDSDLSVHAQVVPARIATTTDPNPAIVVARIASPPPSEVVPAKVVVARVASSSPEPAPSAPKASTPRESDLWSSDGSSLPPPRRAPITDLSRRDWGESAYLGAPMARPRKPLNIRLIAGLGGGFLAMLLMVGAAVLMLSYFKNAGFAILTDSHDQLFQQCINDAKNPHNRFNFSAMTDADIAAAIDRMPAMYAKLERQLERAVKLGPAPKEKVDDFQNKMAQALFQMANEPTHERPSSKSAKSMADLEKATQEFQSLGIASSSYLSSGIRELTTPQDDIHRIYFDENRIVRKSLVALASIHSSRDASRSAATLEALADEVLAVAVRRAGLAPGIDSSPQDYDAVDRSLGLVHHYFVERVKRKYQPSSEWISSVAHFGYSRELLLAASRGKSAEELRSLLAQKRSHQSSADIAQNNPRSSATRPPSPGMPSPGMGSSITSSPPMSNNTNMNGPNPNSNFPSTPLPPPRKPGMSGLNSGPGSPGLDPNYGANIPSMNSAPGSPTPGQPGTFGARPGVGSAPGINGEPGMNGRPGMSGPAPGNPPMGNRSASAKQVQIEVSGKVTRGQIENLARRLQAKLVSMTPGNGSTTIIIGYDGTLSEVIVAIDFGAISSADESKRLIEVIAD